MTLGSHLCTCLDNLFAEQDLCDWFDVRDWMQVQGIKLNSQWQNTRHVHVLEFDSEDAWVEFVLRWL